jgi:hypothetical protein
MTGEHRLKEPPRTEVEESVWALRLEDYIRHVDDLRNRNYEGALTREEREDKFRTAFNLVTPVAQRVLEELNSCFLEGTGQFDVQSPGSDGEGGLVGSWNLTWPLLRTAANRFTGEQLEPIRVTAIFPLTPSGGMQWTHPHLALLRKELSTGIAAAWPFQVTSAEDAERQEPILRVLAEAELHERTFQADLNWRILPFAVR